MSETGANQTAITERLSAQIDSWQQQTWYGIALDGQLTLVDPPDGRHSLPAVVLGRVLMHDGSTATIEISQQHLDEAFATLAPGQACTEFDHPYLAAWRATADRLDAQDGDRIEAVFVCDPADPASSEFDAALRATWSAREHRQAG